MPFYGLDFSVQAKEYTFISDYGELECLRFGEALILMKNLDLSPVESIAADVPEPQKIQTLDRKHRFMSYFEEKVGALPTYSIWQKALFQRVFARVLDSHSAAVLDPEIEPGYYDGTLFFLKPDTHTCSRPASKMLMQDIAAIYINAITRNLEGVRKLIDLFLTKDTTLEKFFGYGTSPYLQSSPSINPQRNGIKRD